MDGWSDTSVPPKVALNYYKAVLAKTGAKPVKDSMRFFMVQEWAMDPEQPATRTSTTMLWGHRAMETDRKGPKNSSLITTKTE